MTSEQIMSDIKKLNDLLFDYEWLLNDAETKLSAAKHFLAADPTNEEKALNVLSAMRNRNRLSECVQSLNGKLLAQLENLEEDRQRR